MEHSLSLIDKGFAGYLFILFYCSIYLIYYEGVFSFDFTMCNLHLHRGSLSLGKIILGKVIFGTLGTIEHSFIIKDLQGTLGRTLLEQYKLGMLDNSIKLY